MQRNSILTRLNDLGVVAVVRGSSKEVGVNISQACIRGEVKAIEVTYTNKFANEIISDLSNKYSEDTSVLIGAGTVLDSETARQAIIAGAKFIVSPSFSEETAKLCNRYQIPYIPGVMTIAEIVKAYESGVDVVKVFPGSVLGTKFICALKGPLPYANVMVTGGVGLNNISDWLKAGANMIGIGGELNTLGEAGNYDEITKICSQYTDKLKDLRGN